MLYTYDYGIMQNDRFSDKEKQQSCNNLTRALTSDFDRIPKVFLDFETFYDPANKYSLSAKGMTYEKYVRDPRFQAILCSFIIPDTGERYWIPNHKGAVRKELNALMLHNCNVIAHNLPFDGFILSDYYGIEPREFTCTMTMARPLHGAKAANSLAQLAKRYSLPNKKEEVHQVMGMRLEHFTATGLQRYGDYGLRDVDLLPPLYGLFRWHYSEMDMVTMSDTIRAGCVCQFDLDKALLCEYIPRLIQLQEDKLAKISAAFSQDVETFRKRLSSNPQFAEVLMQLGVDVPMKDSKTAKNADGTQKKTYAFAKTDMGFKALLTSGDPFIEAVCEARMGEKSTIGITRAKNLLDIAHRGKMPVPLKAFGATTGRWVGYQDINVQNFPKRGGDLTLRKSLRAPKGYSVVTCDLSQIEARRMADHAGQDDLLLQFARNEDPYSDFATMLYGYEVSKMNGRKQERNVGKEGILSLQYGSWFESFYLRLRTAYDLDVTKEFCHDAVLLYRDRYKNIVQFWTQCQNALDVMLYGGTYRFGYEQNYTAMKNRIILPDGWTLRYDDLRVAGKDELNRDIILYTDAEKRETRKIYRGIIANNVTQGSSTRILQGMMMNLRNDGLFWCLTVHDELVFLLPNEDLSYCCEQIQYRMRQRPDWAQRTPIDCELTAGSTYGDQYDEDIWLASGFNQVNADAILKERY
ncbi:DNA polymerase [Xenorhabdus sp. XENO-10]|uniref:DNA polymerase I n=1 Tax=Xenorhabdus yunnanensis TaxID=3025878 RepID=A0ABT5LFP9_9GAMM|nr:DNA polymerase [Xenorhabdus yunnanensis]MDC9589794.1 DNA polymerase [Xenorhabdus yunnanensis]